MNRPLRPMTFANGSLAPVCPVSRSQAPSTQPRSVAIPLAIDLPSALRAINQIIYMLNPNPNDIPQWQEVSRVVTPVRIFNPNDNQQWVDVERIAQVTFQDQTTNGLFQWTY